jgi:hypothetical protein
MRHISIAFVLSTLLLVSICIAQQTSTAGNKNTSSGRDASPIGIEGPVIGGDGTANYIAIWRTPNYLLSSVIYQASGGNVGIGTTTPAAKLDVNGGINTATTYQIGGSTVVSIGSPNDMNLFLGVGAGASNTAGQGQGNTFSGVDAGHSNTSASGNTFYGFQAGYNNTTAGANTFFGFYAGLQNTTGEFNTFSGFSAGRSNTTGDFNTFYGDHSGIYNSTGTRNTFYGQAAGYSNTTGNDNSFSGFDAGYDNTTGLGNTFYGVNAGGSNTTGSYNVFLGNGAGNNNTTGSYNVYLADFGNGTENNTVRIGNLNYQTSAYMAGIYVSTLSSGVPVYVNSLGQLGTQTSSLRFKEQIRDMGDSTNALMKLRPVTFLYKPEYDKGVRTLQYGLIAEEVAGVYPELVAYDKDGQPYTVRYQYLTTMLLNEVQKQYRRAEAEAKVITTQEQKIDELEQRLSRLESLIPQTVAQK